MNPPPLALIVDDHADTTVIFSQAFEQAGFAAEIIRSGQEALARLEEVTPDVVILDLWMPHVGGIEILEHIRADARLAHAYVIVISADPVQANVASRRADRVLVKPISFTRLRSLAMSLLDDKTPQR